MNLEEETSFMLSDVKNVTDFLNMLKKEKEFIYKLSKSVRRDGWDKKISKKTFLKEYPFKTYDLEYDFFNKDTNTLRFYVEFNPCEHLEIRFSDILKKLGCGGWCGGWAGGYYGSFELDIRKFPSVQRKVLKEKLSSE